MPRQSTRTKKPATKAAEPEKVEKVVEEKPQKEQKKRGRKPKQVVEETPVEDKMEVEEEQNEEETTTQTKADKQQPEQQEEAGSDSEDGSDDEEENDLDLNALDESDSDSEFERDLNEKQSAAGIQANKYQNAAEEESSDEEDEDEIDIDDLDAEGEEGEEIKAISQARQTINNKQGLLTALKRFALDTSDKVPFAFHQSVVSKKVTEESIPAIDDDLARELAFMNQALEAARVGRALLRKEGVPFTRPTDYFAETLRSDETMEKVKAKLIEEATAKKASAEARKQRDLKKFGKQVQVAKQQERAKQKRDTLEKIELLKKSTCFPPIHPLPFASISSISPKRIIPLTSPFPPQQRERTAVAPPAPPKPRTSSTSPSTTSSRASPAARTTARSAAATARSLVGPTPRGNGRTTSSASAARRSTPNPTTRSRRAT